VEIGGNRRKHMKLKGTPNRFVTLKTRHMGKIKNVVLFSFDANGDYDYPIEKWNKLSNVDKNKLLKHFGIKDSEPMTDDDIRQTDDDIRQLAKSKGIANWHIKKINRLLKEIEDIKEEVM
jgi:ribonuclease HIII